MKSPPSVTFALFQVVVVLSPGVATAQGTIGAHYDPPVLIEPAGSQCVNQCETVDVHGDSLDINGDGKQDVVCSVYESVRIWTRNAGGAIEDSTSVLIDGQVPTVVDGGYRQILPADFNNDGQVDLFLESHGAELDCGDGTDHCWPGGLNSLLLSNNQGKLVDVTATNLPAFSDFSHGSSALDYDGDGDLDIWVVNLGAGYPEFSYLLGNDGTGHFVVVADASEPWHTPIVGRNGILPEGDWFNEWWSMTPDADGNGDSDLALGARQWSHEEGEFFYKAPLLLNEGAGHFEFVPGDSWPAPDWADQPATQHALVTDLNGDDLDDMLLHQSGAGFFPEGLQILISNGDGSFRDETAERYPRDPPYSNSLSAFQLHDLDRDGHLDLVSNFDWTEDDVMVNDGEGYFRSLDDNWVDLGPHSWVVLDVDGDGGTDFLEQGPNGCFLHKMLLPYGAVLDGTSAGERLIGGAYDNVFRGLEGDDTLDGGLGDDRLDGGPGNDWLLGGKDDDRYPFHAADLTGHDTLFDKMGEFDTLEFIDFGTAGISAVHGAGGDLVLSFGAGGSLTIEDHFTAEQNRIEGVIVGNAVQSLSNDAGFSSGPLDDLLGTPCSPVELTITSPSTISGVFEACDFISASGVQVVAPGATFRAGRYVALGSGFSVAQGADFSIDNSPPIP